MIKVNITDNYNGFNISGDYEDLNMLYNSINYFIGGEDININDYCMKDHLFRFLYEIRHSYQGDRETKLINNTDKYTLKRFKYKKKDASVNNLYYNFNYVVLEAILDSILIKYYINIKEKDNNYYKYKNYVNMFYSLLINSLTNILTNNKYEKVIEMLDNTNIESTKYYPQWYQIVISNYVNNSKSTKIRNFTKYIDKICNHESYNEYEDLLKKNDLFCKLNNYTIDDFDMYNIKNVIIW